MKVLILLAFLIHTVFSNVPANLRDALIEELLEDYQTKRDFDERFCKGFPFDCFECPQCHDNLQFGMCIAGANTAKCLCKWGWTGPNAQRITPATNLGAWTTNRIRADNCYKPCHYTHDYWNQKCLNGGSSNLCDDEECKKIYGTCINDVCVPDCDPIKCEALNGECKEGKCIPKCDEAKCAAKGGKCINGICKFKCCRGWSGPNPTYVQGEDTYYAENCENKCPYLGTGIPNPGCVDNPPNIPPCDPLCAKTGGECIPETGRCKCCRDWTGPNPRWNKDEQKVEADFCDTYCPHKDLYTPNWLCLNNNYVSRLTNKITI